jgi:hypothetical protein
MIGDIATNWITRNDIEMYRPFVLKGLRSKGREISNRRLDEILDDWHGPRFQAVKKDILSEVHSLDEARQMSEQGVLTFTEIPSVRQLKMKKSPGEETDLTERIINLFFEHASILCPSPRTLKDAIRMKENSAVAEWRRWVGAWNRQLKDLNVDNLEVKTKSVIKQIEEANKLVTGANFAKGRISKWVVLVAVALHASELAFGQWPLALPSLGIELFEVAGWANEMVTRNVTRRIRYPWLMISN